MIKVNGPAVAIAYEQTSGTDVEMSIEASVVEEIIAGRMTFQRAFMSGAMKMKGDFKILRTLDQIFVFGM